MVSPRPLLGLLLLLPLGCGTGTRPEPAPEFTRLLPGASEVLVTMNPEATREATLVFSASSWAQNQAQVRIWAKNVAKQQGGDLAFVTIKDHRMSDPPSGRIDYCDGVDATVEVYTRKSGGMRESHLSGE
jgi:hypothetical protein